MSHTIKGVYDHGRLTLDAPPPAERAEVLVTFVGGIPDRDLRPFQPGDFQFDRCRGQLAHLASARISEAVAQDREERE